MSKMLEKSVVKMWMVTIIIMVGLLKGIEGTMDETKVIHVSGKVKCQDCSQGWNDWVQGAKSIQGSRVSITCLDEHKRLAYYGSDTTDEEGEFNMVVDKTIHGHNLKPKDCLVRLVSSPDEDCNVASDFGNGKSGVKLRQPSVIYRGMTKYVVGPFYYTTPTCVDDDVEPDNNSNQGSY